ncbi:amidohydrolase family protein [Enterocloster citroniae]|uniref:amidohydrolase family protein n=1 Tax=Enterocloster citroniae TaxID=358743 RepID=UPI00349EA4DA
MVIDANVYWFPEQVFKDDKLLSLFLADIPRAYGTAGRVLDRDKRKEIVIERPAGCPGVNYAEGDYELEKQLHDMDLAGIDKGVMKVPCCHEWLGLSMAKLFNDGMADYARRSNGRLIPLAVIPPFGGQAAFAELERCHRELGMRGVQMSAHYGNLYLDDEAFAPLFEKLEEYRMTVYVHHTPVPVDHGSLLAYNNLRRSYGRCVDQMTAVCREMMSGMFERYPHVRMVHSMLGGGFFAFKEMMVPTRSEGADQVIRFVDNGEQLARYLSENIFFETSHAQPWGRESLECAVRVLGSDHIIYGSSYPVRTEWLTEGAGFVRGMDLSGDDKENILWRNASRLYGIEVS